MDEELLKAAMREMGARGGRRRYEALTPEQLSEIGRKGGVKSGAARKKAAKKKRAAKT